MPTLAYGFVARGGIPGPPPPGSCAGGPGGGLIPLATPTLPTWPQLFNAQARIGVYPVGWAAFELAWRIVTLRLSTNPPPGVGPGVMSPSPVVTAMDATEKGQLSYHAGTAAGLQLAMAVLAPGAGAIYFPFHLSRALGAGATFTFANLQRPDLVIFSIVLPPPVVPLPLPALSHLVVWECKGHAINVGQAPLGPALLQSVAVTNLTALPGAGPLAAPVVPAAFVASQIDVVGGNYRLQVTDPADATSGETPVSRQEMDNFLIIYYAPYIEILNSSAKPQRRMYEGREFETIEIMPRIRFGMDSEIYHDHFNPTGDITSKVHQVINGGYKNQKPDEIWIDTTGLSIELESGWASPEFGR